jgi:hypothetical protein
LCGIKAKIVFMSTLSGAIILGAFSRLVMAALALSVNKPINLSLRGFAEVIVIGTSLGVIGGLFLIGIRKHIQPGIYRGVILGITLYAGSILFGMLGGRLTLSENTDVLITLVLTGGVYILYGIITEWLLSTVHHDR